MNFLYINQAVEEYGHAFRVSSRMYVNGNGAILTLSVNFFTVCFNIVNLLTLHLVPSLYQQ